MTVCLLECIFERIVLRAALSCASVGEGGCAMVLMRKQETVEC